MLRCPGEGDGRTGSRTTRVYGWVGEWVASGFPNTVQHDSMLRSSPGYPVCEGPGVIIMVEQGKEGGSAWGG